MAGVPVPPALTGLITAVAIGMVRHDTARQAGQSPAREALDGPYPSAPSPFPVVRTKQVETELSCQQQAASAGIHRGHDHGCSCQAALAQVPLAPANLPRPYLY